MDKTGRLNYIELGIDDMTNLVELSDDSLLYNLQTRYSQKIIYTYIGSILISINPYTELNIYDKKQILRYQNKSMQEVPPHLFGIAEINYSKMMLENENQVIVISGESGAGKTESFKRILRYLAHTSGAVKQVKSTNLDLSNDIANKILDSTPLLESFGNAKTIRNDNSSRFGKYVEIFFESGTICGSRTTNYLLEKSRIVNINPDERGYHIFYELLQGLDSFGKSQYYFKNVSDYAYLNNATDFSVKGRDDAANLKDFMKQWSTLGLSNEDLDVALRIISAVLHLGNIKFGEEEDASYLLETENVKIVAKMLKVDCGSLINCLTMKTTDTVKDIASSPVSAAQAKNLRDTLSKHLYSELFDWIVSKVNESLNEKTAAMKRRPSHLEKSLLSSDSKFRCIAMLDIYGFENFPENSLEQLCINYANETLQQFFNRYVFELEQNEYQQEGISWHYITYPDNQPIIDLLAVKPSGIIQILNDECSIPQGSDEAFLSKCDNVHKKNANFEKPKKVHPPQFIIRHFAGNIYYNVTGFLEKNRDIIRKDAIHLIEHCGIDEIATMFRKKKDRTLKNPNMKARTPAVMADFQNSLVTLLEKMKKCQPWFIRCLKPNKKKEPLSFDKDIVMDQMRYTGILETVKIRKSGFPIRILFNTFLSRFYLLQSKDMRRFSKKDPQEACLKMLPKFAGQRGKEFEVGKTKLFLKETFARYLESQVLKIRERSAIKIQRRWRAYWKIREIIIRNRAATRLQAIARGFIERRRIKKFHGAIVKLQSYVRMQLVRQKFIEEHPEFLRYSFNRIEDSSTSKSTAINYKFPILDSNDKSKKLKSKKKSLKFNYNHLKIPVKLAFLLERSAELSGVLHGLSSSNSVTKTSRAQHLYNRDEYQLPLNIDDYRIDDFLDVYGNNIALESKLRPIQNPFLVDSMSLTVKDDCLNAHKLLLRLIYVNTMPWTHQYLAGSYLSHMASTSPQLQMEIVIQIISETIYDGKNTGNRHVSSDADSKRLSRAWTLLGNLLGHVILVPQIFNYVLKYVSTSFGVDQACTCQDKLLQFVNDNCLKVPRLFPSSNLEWRANIRGTKTSLKATHSDNVNNSVYVNSFSTAESFANHSLCFRLNKFRVNKGWSVTVVTQDSVIDCSGHNYVLDVISGLELPGTWSDIVGYGLEHKFLISRYRNGSKPQYFESQLSNSRSKFTSAYDGKSIDTLTSRKTMDSWVDRYFDNSFRGEEAPAVRVQDFIHGLEDDLKVQRSASTHIVNDHLDNHLMTGAISASNSGTHNTSGHTNNGSMHHNDNPVSPVDRNLLEEQLKAAELQNKLYQTSIENELLQRRLLDLRTQSNGTQPPNSKDHQTMQHNQHMPQHVGNERHFLPRTEIHDDSHHSHHANSVIGRIHANDLGHTQFTQKTSSRRSSTIDSDMPLAEHDKITDLKKRRSVVKYSEIAPPSNVVVDDSTVLPELKKKETVSLSQLRAAEIPKVNVAVRAAFLNKFFMEKTFESPETTRPVVKRQVHIASMITAPPRPPIEVETEPTPIPRSSIERSVSPPPPIHQRNLLPRPSIHIQSNILDEDIDGSSNEGTELIYSHAESPRKSISHDYLSVVVPDPEVKPRRKRITSTNKTATILSGLQNLQYYTYDKVPWYLLVKLELFLPKEIRELTVLYPIIFCQIVRDLIEFPCIRWIGDERNELLAMISDIVDPRQIECLLSTPSNLMIRVIDRVQNCELYFSRFYSIQWLSTNSSGHVLHWLAISHSGIRFVEQNMTTPDSPLKIVGRIPYSDLRAVTCDDPDIYNNPQIIKMRTRSNKNFAMLSSHALSAMNLVHEFVAYQEDASRSVSSSRQSNGLASSISTGIKKSRKSRTSDELFAAKVTTFDVNKRRIPMQSVLDNGESAMMDKESSTDICGDIVDFMISNSKYKNRNEVQHNILRWQMDAITEPLLPCLNQNLAKKALEVFSLILVLSGDRNVEPPATIIETGITVFKIVTRSKELHEELIIQIIKQINGNNKAINRLILWNLLATLIIFVGVSKRMEPYMLQHLKSMAQDKSNPDQNSIMSTLKALQKAVAHGPRREMPLDNELRYLLDGQKDTKMTIYVPKDALDCFIRFNNLVGDVIRNICRTFDVTVEMEISEYSLAIVEVNDANEPIKSEEYLDRNVYLFDVINGLARNQKVNSIFYFSRSSWTYPINPGQKSDNYVNFTFKQLSTEVLTENWMAPKSAHTKLLKTLASIAYFNMKGQGSDLPLSDDTLASIFPVGILDQNKQSISKSELIKMISSITTTTDTSGMTELVDYQRKFIDLVIQLPQFGWISFPIFRFSHLPSANNLTINFTPLNILIFNEVTHEKILKISLEKFNSFQTTKIDIETSQFILKYSGKSTIQFISENQRKLVFLLNQYQEIQKLLRNRRSKDGTL